MKAEEEKRAFKEVYPVNPPFALAGIEEYKGRLRYVVIEPILTEEEKQILEKVKRILLEEIRVSPEDLREEEKIRKLVRDKVYEIVKNYKFKLTEEQINKITYYIIRDSLGYGKIDVLIRDPNIEDISVDGANIPIYVWHRMYENLPTTIVLNENELRSLISRLSYRVGKQVTVSRPILDGLLPEGYRVHIALSQISLRGGSLSIRKFAETPFTIIDLIRFGTISTEMAAYFWTLLEHLRSIMVCGATAAGKTTLLNAISMLIHPDAKIITIEESRELRLPHENWVPLVTRPALQEGMEEITLFDLLKSAMRQRPDYVVVGEIRGEEAYTFFQAIATGHSGLCSIHADSIEAAIKRLMTKPMNVPLLLVPMMNTLVLISRVKIDNKIVRRVVRITEIEGVEEKGEWVKLNEVFTWTGADEDRFEYSGRSYMIKKISEIKHIPEEVIEAELRDKNLIIRWMVNRGLRRYENVASIIEEYYRNRTSLLRRVKIEATYYGIK